MLAIPCPTNWDACAVTQNGNLVCIKATSPNYVMDEKVIASCQTINYLVSGDTWIKYSKSGDGCKIYCVCYTELGYVLQSQTVTGGTICIWNQQQCLTDKTKCWNGSIWVSWTANCVIWNDDKWASLGKGYYLKIASDVTRTWVSAATGCGTGYFNDDQNIYQTCQTDCATCSLTTLTSTITLQKMTRINTWTETSSCWNKI